MKKTPAKPTATTEPSPAPVVAPPARKRGPTARFKTGIIRTSVALTPELIEILASFSARHACDKSDALREAVARLGDFPEAAPRPEVRGKG